ncbi:MAG: two-component system LytT family response regulator [Crocinitomix sp.]|jgi:two-component system LytT family response regulator
MKKIKAILIDDEPDTIEVLQLLLEMHCPEVQVVACANNVDDGLAKIEHHDPHLVFLDIEMPGKNGFDLLRAIPEVKFQTIIVSGFENYAISAIKFSALDYVLKPIDVADLVNAVSKVNPVRMSEDPRLGHLNELLQQEIGTYDKLIIPSTKGFKSLKLAEIEMMESQAGNYCTVFVNGGKQELLSKAMSYFEGILPVALFFRINRSHLVNMGFVKSYISRTGEVELQSGKKLIVSTRKRSTFKAKVGALLNN